MELRRGLVGAGSPPDMEPALEGGSPAWEALQARGSAGEESLGPKLPHLHRCDMLGETGNSISYMQDLRPFWVCNLILKNHLVAGLQFTPDSDFSTRVPICPLAPI